MNSHLLYTVWDSKSYKVVDNCIILNYDREFLMCTIPIRNYLDFIGYISISFRRTGSNAIFLSLLFYDSDITIFPRARQHHLYLKPNEHSMMGIESLIKSL